MHDDIRRRSRRVRLLVAAAALAAAMTIAACGSDTPSGSTASSSTSPTSGKSGPPSHPKAAGSTEAFSKCMRANGVPNFPDLGSNGMEIAAGKGTLSINGVSVNAPAYKAARPKCRKYLPHQQVTQEQATQLYQHALTFAKCMRRNGVPDYPDPQANSSSGGNQAGHLPPSINPSAPGFQTAAKTCGGFNPKG